jgi:hypothetical protein
MVRSITRIFLSWHILWRLLAAFLVPYFLFSIITTIAADTINESLGQMPPPRVGIVHQDQMPMELMTTLRARTTLSIVKGEDNLMARVENDSLDIGLLFDQLPTGNSYRGNIVVYYNSMRNAGAVRQVLEMINNFEEELVAYNLQEVDIDKGLVNPIQIDKRDTFDSLLLLGQVMKSAKGGISNVFNFLLILLVLWLARQLVLRTAIYAPDRFLRNFIFIVLGTALGMMLVFWGLQVGLDIEQEGMIRSVIRSVQQLILVDKLYPVLILWIPTWLFVLGLLGAITAGSSTRVGAHGRTFWVVVLLHGIALFSFASAKTAKVSLLVLPIVNVFRLGQRNLRGELEWSNWSIAFVATWAWAIVFLLLWWWLDRRFNEPLETQPLEEETGVES